MANLDWVCPMHCTAPMAVALEVCENVRHCHQNQLSCSLKASF
jgi:hypothetical protein